MATFEIEREYRIEARGMQDHRDGKFQGNAQTSDDPRWAAVAILAALVALGAIGGVVVQTIVK